MSNEMSGDSPAATNLINLEDHRRGGRGGGGVPQDIRELPLSDVWNGKWFAHLWRATTRYNHETGKWIVYKDGRWAVDNTGERDRRMLAAIEALRTTSPSDMMIAGKTPDQLNAHYYKCLDGRNISKMEVRARSFCACTSDEFDTDPMVLPVKNGTLDLNTGELRPHGPEDMMMKQAPAEFDPEAVPTEWLKLADQWMAGDKEMVAYLRRMVASFLTGDVGDEAFFMLLGPSGTGKGTFVSTVEALLGNDFAFALSVDWFLKSNNKPLPIDVHAARGMRLLTVSENDKGAKFNTSKIKQWTGGDAMTGKGLFENLSNFMPTHKLLLQTNHEPGFGDATIARRLKNIGFLSVVPELDRKWGLKKYLRENELSGILNWALGALPGEERLSSDGDGPLLRGLADWRVNRLNTPQAVKLATMELLEAQDEFREFVDTLIHHSDPQLKLCRLSRTDGYAGFRRWCERNLVNKPLGRNAFVGAMREAGFKDAVSGSSKFRGWYGIQLAETEVAPRGTGLCKLCPKPAVANGQCADCAKEVVGDERFSLE